MRRHVFILAIASLISLHQWHPSFGATLPVIPGVHGFGTETRAAYGGIGDPKICIVTSLGTSGGSWSPAPNRGVNTYEGTLAQCLNSNPNGSGKIILFDVSGNIGDSTMRTLSIRHPYTTIAGQSAPSPGISIHNHQLTIRTHDVLIQHIRLRHAFDVKPSVYNPLSISTVVAGEDVYNVVVDHCSVAWGEDETLLVSNYISGAETRDVTIANSFIGEGIYLGDFHGEAKSTLIARSTQRVALVGNLFMSSTQRMPWMQNRSGVVVNNLIYNGGSQTIKLDPVFSPGQYAVVANVTRGGPNSSSRARNYVANIFNKPGEEWPHSGTGSSVYIAGNACDAGVQAGPTDWSLVYDPTGIARTIRVATPPLWPVELMAHDWSSVQALVLGTGGAWAAARDGVDSRWVSEVQSRTGSIKSVVPPYPDIPINKHAVSIPTDPHRRLDGSGYTNLEKWLHQLSTMAEGQTVSVPSGIRASVGNE